MNSPAPVVGSTNACGLAVRIMATADLHMHLMPYDYVADLPAPSVGLARTAALIRNARTEAKNTILVDNGDFLHGTPMGDAITRSVLRGRREPRGMHPLITSMIHLGYDAMTLGNHDFDHGVEYLGQVLQAAPFPVVISNLKISHTGGSSGPAPLPFAVPFTILNREMIDEAGRSQRLKIGLFGVLPPGSITGLRGSPFRAEIRDIVDTAQTIVPQLRAMGADIVVALAHSGIGAPLAEPGLENAVVPLAKVPGIDAIIAGHAHQVFPSPSARWPAGVDPETGRVHGVPVVSPGFWGSHLGLIDLTLKRDASGRWQVGNAQVEARPVIRRDGKTGAVIEEVAPDPGILKRLESFHEATVKRATCPVGQTQQRLHSYFATVAPSPALDIVHRAMAWYGARELADSPLADLPLLASTAPFKSGGLAGPGFYSDIRPGPLTLTTIGDLYLYPNDLCAVRLTGAQLVDWLERSVSVFNQIEPGQSDQPLFSAKTPAYGFESVAGVDFEIDLTAPPRHAPDGSLRDPDASRVRAISIGGKPLEMDDEVVMMTNSYRITGGGGYPAPDPEQIALDIPICIRDVIAEYLEATGPFDERPWASWRLRPVAGASAHFVSAPEAQELLGELGEHDVRPIETEPDGFMRFRLSL